MDDYELVNIIKSHIEDGLGSDFGEISDDRQEVFDRYMGELYGNEREGESKVTTRDIFETIEWAMPPLMRHFTSGDRPVEFEADGPGDEQAAQQETEAVQQEFWKDNNGFVCLYLMFKTTLMYPNGYIKICREERERTVFEKYRGMDVEDIALITDDAELEMVESSQLENGLWEVKVKRKLTRGRNLVLVLPEDEVVVDSNWTSIDLEDCPFVCHYPDKTHSELLEMGYDEDDLEEVYGAGSEAYSSEETNRRYYSDESYNTDPTHKALRKYKYHEAHMLVDYDDDGIVERRKVVMIGDKIFDNEETDEQPIISASAILMPHKHVGVSLGQIVMDLQEIRTTVWRQTLNNMYRMNNPRTIALKGANISDIINNRTNGIIRAKTPQDVTIEDTKPIINQVVPLLNLIDDTKDMRTGITKSSTVPNPDILEKSAEGSYLAFVEKADQRIDLLARLFAETIIKPIFIKLHTLILKHGDTKFMKLSGQWVRVDPTMWRRRESMTVRVGLGISSRQQKLAAARVIQQDHNYLIENGAVADPQSGKPGLVTLQHVYNGRKLMIEAIGEQEVDKYYQNPSQIPPRPAAPPPPDPTLLMIQSNERIEGQKRQLEVQKIRADAQMKAMQAQADAAMQERKFRFEQLEQFYKQQIAALTGRMKEEENRNKDEAARMKIEIEALQTQLEDAQHDEKLAVEKYKAELDAETKITLKKMDIGEKQIDMIEQLTERQGLMNESQQTVQQALMNLSSLIEEIRQPKEIVYDADGEIVGVRNPMTGQTRKLKRDEEGNPLGLM